MTASGAKARLLACRTWRIRSVVSTQISRSSRQAGCTGTPAVHGQVRVCVWSTVGGCEFTSWSWCTGRSLRTSFEPGVAGGSSEGGGRCGKLCGLRAPSEQSLRSKPVHSQVKSIHKQKSENPFWVFYGPRDLSQIAASPPPLQPDSRRMAVTITNDQTDEHLLQGFFRAPS